VKQFKAGKTDVMTATALEDLELLMLDKDSLQSLLDRTPPLSREIGSVIEARRKAMHGVWGSDETRPAS
jgi:CRP-like cAMP-binding protein